MIEAEAIEERREEHKLLPDAVEAIVSDENLDGEKVHARRLGFNRRRLDLFGGVVIDEPTALFRVWGCYDIGGPPLEATLEIGRELWRIVGVAETVVCNVPVAFNVMVAKYANRD